VEDESLREFDRLRQVKIGEKISIFNTFNNDLINQLIILLPFQNIDHLQKVSFASMLPLTPRLSAFCHTFGRAFACYLLIQAASFSININQSIFSSINIHSLYFSIFPKTLPILAAFTARALFSLSSRHHSAEASR